MKKRMLPIYAYILILTLFTIRFVMQKNYEFLLYTVTLGILIWAVAKSDKTFKYSGAAKWGLTIWLLSHLAGGSIYIGETKLYNLILVPLVGEPYNILKYDQFIHFFCYVIITLFVYSLIMHFAKPNSNKLLIALIVILASTGIGAVNEIIEFSTVVAFGSTGVGGYTNNALDLIFNVLGAIIGMLIASKTSQPHSS